MGAGPASKPVVLRGGYESRAALSLVALLFLGCAAAMALDPGKAGAGTAFAFATPIAMASLGLLWLVGRASVTVTHDEVIVRHIADPKTRRIPRTGIVGVELVSTGSEIIPAVVPILQFSAEEGQSRSVGDTQLTPLVTWTWWRSATPPRAERLTRRLAAALEVGSTGEA